MSLNALAVKTLERHAAEDLIPMLGLVTEDGSLPPDDTNVYTFPSTDKSAPGAENPRSPLATNRDRSNVPPGLVTLKPVEEAPKPRRGPKPQPKVIRPRKPREVPECGTYKAYARHRRRNEEVDEACREASREYGRTNNSEYRARKRKEKELKRLLKEGVSMGAAQVLVEEVQ